MDIEDTLNSINTKKDFENFLKLFQENLSSKRGDWENNDLESYIEAIYGYVYDLNDKQLSNPSWQLLAEILLAARTYE